MSASVPRMGLATAQRLISEGARVVITGRDRTRLDAATKDLGERAVGIVADAADLADLDALMQAIRQRYGRLDVVFANAGVGVFKPTAEVTERDFDYSVDVNFKGVFFTIQKALPLMTSGGAIVINASWTLYRGNGLLSLYSATKAAVHNLACTLAADLAPNGIRVNSISPGYLDTPMYPEAALTDQEAAEVKSRVVAGRVRPAPGDRRCGGVSRLRRGLLHQRSGPGRRRRPRQRHPHLRGHRR